MRQREVLDGAKTMKKVRAAATKQKSTAAKRAVTKKALHAAWTGLRLPRGAVVSRSSANELVAKIPFLSSAATKSKRYALADAEAVMERYISLLERQHGWVAVESEATWDFPAWHFRKPGEARGLFALVAPGRQALELNLVWNEPG